MYSTIVVPLDGSAFGERALPAAVALARRSDAVLELVHAREPAASASGAPVPDPRFDDEEEQLVRSRVSSLADALARDAGLRVRPVFLNGDVAAAVQAYVAERGADLIVMTSHGRGGLSRAWLGSVADQLVRRSTAPLLVVRADGQGMPGAAEPLFRRVLVPLDGSPRAEEVLAHAAALGTPGVTEYLLLNVFTPRPSTDLFPSDATLVDREEVARHLQEVQARGDAYLARVADSFREIGARVTTYTTLRGQAGPAILEFAREHGADLIVLSTRVRSAAERLLIGSVADKVLRGADVPVLLRGPQTRVASESRDAASTTESGAGSAALAR